MSLENTIGSDTRRESPETQKFRFADIDALHGYVNAAVDSASPRDPDMDTFRMYSKIAEALPTKMPHKAIETAGEAIDDGDKRGKDITTILKISASLKLVGNYERFAKDDIDDMTQAALTNVYEHVDNVPRDTGSSSKVFNLARGGVVSYLHERDGYPKDWYYNGRADSFNEAMKVSNRENPYGLTTEKASAFATNIFDQELTAADPTPELVQYEDTYREATTEDSVMGEFPHPKHPSIEEIEEKIDVRAALKTLTTRQADVIKKYVGMDTGESSNTYDIAIEDGSTYQNIQQHYGRGIASLRRSGILDMKDEFDQPLPEPRPIANWQKVVAMRNVGETVKDICEELQLPRYVVQAYRKIYSEPYTKNGDDSEVNKQIVSSSLLNAKDFYLNPHPEPRPVANWQKVVALRNEGLNTDQISEKLHVPKYVVNAYKKIYPK